MSELSATAAHPGMSSRTGARGAVTVGDYRGAPAAQAARSVRRLGLRPGLDRQFGGEPQSFGLVVAQEPDPGGDAPRGSLVTLYVSAPSAGAQDPQPEPNPSPAISDEAEPAARVPGAGRAASPTRVRRKRRAHPQAAAPPEPAPAVPGAEPSTPSVPWFEEAELQEPGAPEQTGEQQTPSIDELTVAMRDVFTPEAPLRGRGLYPRKPMVVRLGGWWAWLKAHRAIALAACAALGLWVASGSMSTRHTGALTGQTDTSATATARTSRGLGARVRTGATRSHPTRSARRRRQRGGSPQTRPHASGAAVAMRARASNPASSGASAQLFAPAPPAVAQPTAPQTGGGPFSP
jgi:hypothetical protein